jgi:hypothetical protein
MCGNCGVQVPRRLACSKCKIKTYCVRLYHHCKVIILRMKQSSACQKNDYALHRQFCRPFNSDAMATVSKLVPTHWIVNNIINGITKFQSKFSALLSIAALEILGLSQVLGKPESTLSIIGVASKQRVFTIEIGLKDSPGDVEEKSWKGFMVGEAYKSSLDDLKLTSPRITDLLALLQARQPAVLLEFKFPNTNMDSNMMVQPLSASRNSGPVDWAKAPAYTVDEATVWPPIRNKIQERIDKS